MRARRSRGEHGYVMLLAAMVLVPLMVMAGFAVDLWYALSAPAGTPKDIVGRFNAVVNEILASPTVKEQFAKQGLVPVGGTPESLAALIARDLPRWAKVVKEANIKAEQ